LGWGLVRRAEGGGVSVEPGLELLAAPAGREVFSEEWDRALEVWAAEVPHEVAASVVGVWSEDLSPEELCQTVEWLGVFCVELDGEGGLLFVAGEASATDDEADDESLVEVSHGAKDSAMFRSGTVSRETSRWLTPHRFGYIPGTVPPAKPLSYQPHPTHTKRYHVTRVIAIANQKGGVGKTTTAVNLAASLAVAEQRTLLIDGDPQGNATSGIGIDGNTIQRTVYHALIGECSLLDATVRAVQFEHLDVTPATPDLAGAEIELVDHPNRQLVMREAIAPARNLYDFILIDCPPSLGLITVNMLAAADAILIPLQCEYYALEGLSQLLSTIHMIQRGVNTNLAIDGVLLTMYDARLNLSRQVATDAREYFGAKVFETVIPRNVRLAEAPSFGKPIILYDVASVGAQAYMAVARELIDRTRHHGDPLFPALVHSESPNAQ
jgi:chromosome partitioning protein